MKLKATDGKVAQLAGLSVDEMLLSLVEDCYGIGFADAMSYFYQLVLQTIETNPNIIGPLKPPVSGPDIKKYSHNGKIFIPTKKVDVPQDVDYSVWVVRGFYPSTAIPFKMVLSQIDRNWPTPIFTCKISMGTFGKAWVNVDAHPIREYVEEVAEKTLLDESVEDIKKPKKPGKKRVYKCMSPKGLALQKKKVKK